jgi:glucose/arabinose dehydrogenase
VRRVARSHLAVIMAVALFGCATAGLDPDDSPLAADPDVIDATPTDAATEPRQPEAQTEDEPEPEPLAPLERLGLELVADGLTHPVDATALPDGRLLVVERRGIIQVVAGGTMADQPYADLTGIVHANSIEQGLLGIALHPRFPDDPRVFLYHSLRNNNNVLVSYLVRDDGSGIDPDSRAELLIIEKEPDKVRHNGGQVVFGPDGHLFVAVGDAARASVNGQDPSTLPGTILRIDVDSGDPYAIPPDNPFADGVDGAPEVWWFGLRNPWRFSIDAMSGLAYIADVGQEDIEEVNVVPFTEGGHNFGWPSFEGTDRFYSSEPFSPVTDPVLEVRHDDTDQGCSITGGFVYRGTAIPELDGHFLYADWCHGWIRSFRYDNGEVADQDDWSDQLDTQMVSSFALDADGELLVLDMGAGSIFRIVPTRDATAA